MSVLWIEACKKQLRLVDPSKFPIHSIEQYENPELFKKTKVTINFFITFSRLLKIIFKKFQVKKFFQTENELKIKKKKTTPTLIKFKPIRIPKKAKDNLTGMWNEFKERQIVNSNGIDYFSENFNVVDLLDDSKATAGNTKAVNSKKSLVFSAEASVSVQQTVTSPLHLNETTVNNVDEISTSAAADSDVSQALAKLPQVQNKESLTVFKTPSTRKTMLARSVVAEQSPSSLVRVTRRTSMLALSSPSVNDTSIPRNRQVMPEEITEITDDNQTNNKSEAMEITPNVVSSPRVIASRRTIFTSSAMDITEQQPKSTSTRKRNSVIPARFKDFEVNTKKYLGNNSSDATNVQSEKSNRRRTVFAPNDKASNSTTVSILSPPNRRRTLNTLKQTTSNKIDVSPLNEREEATANQTVFAPNEASSPLIVNNDSKQNIANLRRTLFKSSDAIPSTLVNESPVNKIDDAKPTSSKRRRTLLPPSSTASSPLVVSTLKKVTELKAAGSSRRQFTPSQESSKQPHSSLSNTANEIQNRRRTCFATSQTESTPSSKGKRN